MLIILRRQPEWLKEIVPNTTVKRDYGIHRSAEKIIDYLHTCLKKYMESPIFVEKNEAGEVIREVLGVSKIFDPVLLEEIIQYNDSGNFDRIIAAELAIAQALKMDPIMGKIGGTSDDEELLLCLRRREEIYSSLILETTCLDNQKININAINCFHNGNYKIHERRNNKICLSEYLP